MSCTSLLGVRLIYTSFLKVNVGKEELRRVNGRSVFTFLFWGAHWWLLPLFFGPDSISWSFQSFLNCFQTGLFG